MPRAIGIAKTSANSDTMMVTCSRSSTPNDMCVRSVVFHSRLNKKFAESLQVDYPILSDPDKKVAEAYGVVHEGRAVAERWTFYIDKDGVIKEIDKGVQKRTEQAGQDIADKVKQLGLAGKE